MLSVVNEKNRSIEGKIGEKGLKPSTSIEKALQIRPFYAKQTQFPKSQMNVNQYNTMNYEKKSNWTLGENKPNFYPLVSNAMHSKGANPIKANLYSVVFSKLVPVF